MTEETGDLWTLTGDARCITTNGTRKKNREAVMGRGCAQEAANRYPDLLGELGYRIGELGTHVTTFYYPDEIPLIVFPVKHNWWEPADLKLIKRSAQELMSQIRYHEWRRVLLPRPGCGNGKLKWADVRAVLEPIIDERVVIVSK